jgi:hypothetical protein
MGKRDNPRRPARRVQQVDPKPIILIVSEGEVTEPEYLEGFAAACQNSRVRIETIGAAGVPRTVVTVARDKKKKAASRASREGDDFLAYDEVWCVFDVDDHPEVQNALQMARDNGLLTAMSNPCIELWLYLHFADQPGLQHRDALMAKLQRHLPAYSKNNKHIDITTFKSAYQVARDRAQRLEENASEADDEGRNPTTGFWKLTESIRGTTPLPLT